MFKGASACTLWKIFVVYNGDCTDVRTELTGCFFLHLRGWIRNRIALPMISEVLLKFDIGV